MKLIDVVHSLLDNPTFAYPATRGAGVVVLKQSAPTVREASDDEAHHEAPVWDVSQITDRATNRVPVAV